MDMLIPKMRPIPGCIMHTRHLGVGVFYKKKKKKTQITIFFKRPGEIYQTSKCILPFFGENDVICVSMIDSVCPWTYSSGDPIKNLVCCLSVLEPTACHVGQNCFYHSTSRSSELTVLVTFRILPRQSWLFWLRFVFYLVGVDHGQLVNTERLSCWRQYASLPSPADVTPII